MNNRIIYILLFIFVAFSVTCYFLFEKNDEPREKIIVELNHELKDVEAFVEPEKAKYQKASAKYKDDIKAFCEKYIREHPKFRQPMNQY